LQRRANRFGIFGRNRDVVLTHKLVLPNADDKRMTGCE
jgi:hypothetical protein